MCNNGFSVCCRTVRTLPGDKTTTGQSYSTLFTDVCTSHYNNSLYYFYVAHQLLAIQPWSYFHCINELNTCLPNL